MAKPLTITAKWRDRVDRTMKFIDELADTPSMGNPKWRTKMLKHYARLMEQQLRDAPKWCQSECASYRARCKTALERSKLLE